jgi:hypothetical protein
MKYNLVKKVTDRAEIDSVLLNILAYPDQFYCDSILETDDRVIVRYLRREIRRDESTNEIISRYRNVFYIHSSKEDHTFTKICIYELEEL